MKLNILRLTVKGSGTISAMNSAISTTKRTKTWTAVLASIAWLEINCSQANLDWWAATDQTVVERHDCGVDLHKTTLAV